MHFCPCVSGLPHIASCFEGSSVSQHVSEFLFEAERSSSAGLYSVFFIQPSASLYLGGIPLMALVSNVAVDLGVQVSVGVSAFRALGMLAEAEWGVGRCSVWKFLGSCSPALVAAAPPYVPTSNARGFRLLCILANTYFLVLFWCWFFYVTAVLMGVRWYLVVKHGFLIAGFLT